MLIVKAAVLPFWTAYDLFQQEESDHLLREFIKKKIKTLPWRILSEILGKVEARALHSSKAVKTG